MSRFSSTYTPYPDERQPFSLNNHDLRIALGLLGIFLPFTLVIFDNLYAIATSGPLAESEVVRGSISAYFYSQGGGVFVGFHIIIGILLILYPGFSPQGNNTDWDKILTTSAGVYAILLAIIPTGTNDIYLVHNWLHLIAAILFLGALGIISWDQFTNFNTTVGKEKRIFLFKLSGFSIFYHISLILVYIFSAEILDYDFVRENTMDLIFWFETFAVLAFGISWLVKSMSDNSPWVTGTRRYPFLQAIIIGISIVVDAIIIFRVSDALVTIGMLLSAVIVAGVLYFVLKGVILVFYKVAEWVVSTLNF